MALAVRATTQEQPHLAVVSDPMRRPYRCGGHRVDSDGRQRECNRRVGDIEDARTLLIRCERCGQEHAFALRSVRESVLEARIAGLLALIAYLSYADGAAP